MLIGCWSLIWFRRQGKYFSCTSIVSWMCWMKFILGVVTAIFSIGWWSFIERIGGSNLCRLKIVLSYFIISIQKVRDMINTLFIYDHIYILFSKLQLINEFLSTFESSASRILSGGPTISKYYKSMACFLRLFGRTLNVVSFNFH